MTVAKFRAATSNSANIGGDVGATKPSGTAVDDIVLLGAISTGGQTLTTPTGFTALYTFNSGGIAIGLWWKRATGAEGASFPIVTTGGANPRVAVSACAAYSGCALGIDPQFGGALQGLGANCTAPSVDMGAGAALVVHFGFATSPTVTLVRSTPPPGMKERADDELDDSSAGVDSQAQVAISDGFVLGNAASGALVSTIAGGTPTNWGMAVVLYQTPIASTVPTGKAGEVLIELTHYDESAATEVVKKYSGRGVTFSGGEFYERRILGSVEIWQNAADRAAVGGVVATTVSDVRLDNKDGVLDDIYRRMLAVGRTVVIKRVNVASETPSDLGVGAASSAATIFSGIVAAMTPDETTMVLTVSDLAERLNVPLQVDEFSGAAGLGGGAELQGQSMPLTFGRVYNMKPQELGNFTLGDGSLYTYMISSREVNGIDAVYERGVAMTEVGVAPIAGQYREWLASGVFQLGFTPNGIITCTGKGDDPASDIYANQHGEILQRMLTFFGPVLSSSLCELSTFTDVDAILPGIIGIHFPTGDRSSTRDAVERVLRSGGIWLSGGRNGKIRLSMAMPSPSERIALSVPDIVSLRPLPLPASLQPAPHRIAVECEKNWCPLSDISSSVTGGTRRKLTGPGRTVESISTKLQARQKTERAWFINGLWFNDSDATTRADQVRTWIEQGLRAFEVVTDRYPGQIELGTAVEIASYPRFGLDAGFSGIVAGWRERPVENQLALVLIGGGPDAVIPNRELREDGTFELREDGAYELRE